MFLEKQPKRVSGCWSLSRPIATACARHFSHQCRTDRGVCGVCVCVSGQGKWGTCEHSNASTLSVLNKSIHALSALCLQGTMVRLKESHKGTLEAFVGVSLCVSVCVYVLIRPHTFYTLNGAASGFFCWACVILCPWRATPPQVGFSSVVRFLMETLRD